MTRQSAFTISIPAGAVTPGWCMTSPTPGQCFRHRSCWNGARRGRNFSPRLLIRASFDCVRQKLIELRTWHFQLLRMRIDIFREALEFSRSPTAFEFCTVLAFFVELEVVVVHKVGKFGVADRAFSHDCGNEEDAIGLRQYQVAGQHYGASDPDRRIDRSQCHLLPEGGIVAFVEAVEVRDLPVLFLVSYPTVEDEARVRVGGYSVTKIGTDECTVDDFAKAVGDIHVPYL